MAKIRCLDPHVADLIAAGEVVERPASVVKELMENSIDAGANALTVEIKNGGMSYMRVSDNGCGMSAEDAVTAFLRHATSKLSDERGLEAIGTLGFRGEALAAISAVSRVELLTREKGSDEGFCVTLEAGEITDEAPAGCPEGTTIIVRELFFNTPARLKYMKKDSAEASAVSTAVIRCALSHPEISIRYIKDGEEQLHTPGDGSVDGCVYSIFGADFAKGLLSAVSEDENISVHGVITPPALSKGNRGWQFFFVNGRCVKSLLLQAALEQAYKNSMFTGKFPGCVLYLKMKLSAVDVNVHPAKTEVRFLNEKAVFNAVYYAVFSALENEKKPPELVLPPQKSVPAPPTVKAEPKKDFYKTVPAEQFRERNSFSQEKKSEKTLSSGNYGIKYSIFEPAEKEKSEQAKPVIRYNAPVIKEEAVKEEAKAEVKIEVKEEVNSVKEPEIVTQEEIKLMPVEETFRVIGEALNTYILVEKGQSIIIIDKHAAHERMIFDKLKAGGEQIPSQYMLTPLICQLGEEYSQILSEEKDELERLGFELDKFGRGEVALRRLPADLDEKDVEAILSETAQKLISGGSIDGIHDELLHSVACKAAIKAGRESNEQELKFIAEKVLSGQVRYCPHGRPVMMELGKSALDRGFRRI